MVSLFDLSSFVCLLPLSLSLTLSPIHPLKPLNFVPSLWYLVIHLVSNTCSRGSQMLSLCFFLCISSSVSPHRTKCTITTHITIPPFFFLHDFFFYFFFLFCILGYLDFLCVSLIPLGIYCCN
ncbi:hypothetical protein BKA57DRAFT_91981 [Linnemannia elongata]|nr:hypothetical protein BKA57DRAFT_91981 [Linnemannia elongata]